MRIVEKTYFNENVFFIAQLWESNCFKRWVTIGIASSRERAEKLGKDFAT